MKITERTSDSSKPYHPIVTDGMVRVEMPNGETFDLRQSKEGELAIVSPSHLLRIHPNSANSVTVREDQW